MLRMICICNDPTDPIDPMRRMVELSSAIQKLYEEGFVLSDQIELIVFEISILIFKKEEDNGNSN